MAFFPSLWKLKSACVGCGALRWRRSGFCVRNSLPACVTLLRLFCAKLLRFCFSSRDLNFDFLRTSSSVAIRMRCILCGLRTWCNWERGLITGLRRTRLRWRLWGRCGASAGFLTRLFMGGRDRGRVGGNGLRWLARFVWCGAEGNSDVVTGVVSALRPLLRTNFEAVRVFLEGLEIGSHPALRRLHRRHEAKV